LIENLFIMAASGAVHLIGNLAPSRAVYLNHFICKFRPTHNLGAKKQKTKQNKTKKTKNPPTTTTHVLALALNHAGQAEIGDLANVVFANQNVARSQICPPPKKKKKKTKS
jgi:hypothetical protein